MLEIVNKKDSGGGCDFAKKMVEIQNETTINVFNLACEYGVDPFEVLKIFGTHLIEVAADMRADYKRKCAIDAESDESAESDDNDI